MGLGANVSDDVPVELPIVIIIIALVLDDGTQAVRAVFTYNAIVNAGALSPMKINSMTESCRLW